MQGVASHADVLRDSSRVPVPLTLKSADISGAGIRDEPLRTSAWEAMQKGISCKFTYQLQKYFPYPLSINCMFE